MRLRYPNEEGTVSDQESATAPEAAAPAPQVATAPEASKPEATETQQPKQETDWKKAYAGLQTNYNRLFESNADLKRQINASRSDMDALLKVQMGEDGFKAHVASRQAETERQQALEAARAAQEYIPHSITVVAQTMKAAGVPQQKIETIFTDAAKQPSAAEWAASVAAASSAAIADARTESEQRIASEVKAKSQDEINAQAQALAERTVRAKGLDKVDLGRGQSRTPETSFIERVRAADRSTPEGEAQYQAILREAKRGTLKT